MVRTEAMQEVREGRWDKAGGKSEIERERETVVMMGWEALHKQQQQTVMSCDWEITSLFYFIHFIFIYICIYILLFRVVFFVAFSGAVPGWNVVIDWTQGETSISTTIENRHLFS